MPAASQKKSKPEPPRRTAKKIAKTAGKGDKKSDNKTKFAKDQANKTTDSADTEIIPRAADGQPLIKIQMAATELLPTGQYANVTLGPAQITAWIDPREEEHFDEEWQANVAGALNVLGDVAAGQVIAAQRDATLESMQEQVREGKDSDD